MSESAAPTRNGPIARAALILGPLAAAAFLAFGDLDPARPQVTACAAVALLMAVWWITEALPLGATAMLPVVLFPALGVMPANDVASQYFNDAIFLFLGGFLMALSIERWGLHRRIALRALLLFGARPRRILFGFMAVTGFLSMWISNTAATMMMAAIALAILQQIEETHGPERVRRYGTGVLLGVAYGASVGGLATLVGTPTNTSFLRQFEILFPDGPEVSFATWGQFGAPVSLAMLLVAFAVLAWLFRPPPEGLEIDETILTDAYAALGPMRRPERRVFVLFVALAVLWVFRGDLALGAFTIPGWSGLLPHGALVRDGTVAAFVAVLLFATPAGTGDGERLADWRTAQRLPWHIVLLFGGGFALARGFVDSGLSAWTGDQLSALRDVSPLVLVFTLCVSITFLTEFTSNAATAEMILPILGALASEIGRDPLLLMVPVTLSCSCAFTMPVATPPNAIVFGTDRVRIRDMVRAGIVLNLIGAVLITALMMTLGRWAWGVDLDVMPAWATTPGGH